MVMKALSGKGVVSGGSFRGNIASTSSWQYLDCGFNPSEVIYWATYRGTDAIIFEYDITSGIVYRWYKNYTKADATSTVLDVYIKVDGTQIGFNNNSDSFGTVEIMAIA